MASGKEEQIPIGFVGALQNSTLENRYAKHIYKCFFILTNNIYYGTLRILHIREE